MSASYPDQDNGSEISGQKHRQVTPALVSAVPFNNHQIIRAVRALRFFHILRAVIELNCTEQS